jgi:hypothetical protein
MTTQELLQAVSQKAAETKKALKASFFSDKNYYNEMVAMFPKMPLSKDVYENINNLASKYAMSLDY